MRFCRPIGRHEALEKPSTSVILGQLHVTRHAGDDGARVQPVAALEEPTLAEGLAFILRLGTFRDRS